MLIAEKSLALHETIHQLGFGSLEDFALAQAREKLLNEITICTANIEKFENKYKMDYADFCLHFNELQTPLFEKEDDSSDWNAELKQLNILQKRLARLS